MDGAGGMIEENEIFGNEHAGIAVETGAAPTIKKNRIHDGKQVGKGSPPRRGSPPPVHCLL